MITFNENLLMAKCLLLFVEVESTNVTSPATTPQTKPQTKETRKQKYTRSSSYDRHSNQGNFVKVIFILIIL